MTKKNKRRGFTIVELVIVIAVIAILAAVLIPTYANLVKKANEAKAQAEAKNLITEMLADILLGKEGDADLLVFSEKGSDVYAYAYSRTEGKIIAYKNNPTAKTGSFENTVQSILTAMGDAITDCNVAEDDWRHPNKIKAVVNELNTKGTMIVYANYTINVDKFAPHVHTWETAWMFDETYHWHKCAGCDEITGKAEHVFGDDGRCKDCGLFNTKNVGEFEKAIKAAKPGDTIRLGADITGTSAFSIGKNITIDLNGYTLSSTASNTLKLTSGANVTVEDSGENGKITNEYSGSAVSYAVYLSSSGTVFTLNSGTVQSNGKDDLYSLTIGNASGKTCTVNIKGGTVSNPIGHNNSRTIKASKGMTVNIYGGTINGGQYALDVFDGSVSNIFGGTLSANAKERRDDEYGTSYAIHAKGKASITIGSLDVKTVSPTVEGIIFESNGGNTSLPTIKLVKGEITNPIYPRGNYPLFKLDIVADAPVTFTDDTAKDFLADDLQMTESNNTWTVTKK